MKKDIQWLASEAPFCDFVCQLLQRNNVPLSQVQFIARNTWRTKTINEKKGIVKLWRFFAKEKKRAWYDL